MKPSVRRIWRERMRREGGMERGMEGGCMDEWRERWMYGGREGWMDDIRCDEPFYYYH